MRTRVIAGPGSPGRKISSPFPPCANDGTRGSWINSLRREGLNFMGTRSKSDAWDDIGHGNEPPAPHKAGRKKSLDLPDHLYLDGDGKKRHKDMCGPGTVGRGCGFFFDPSKYNRAALLCSECANKMGADLDIPYEFIPHAITVEGNLGYFREKVPVLETFPLRQQIRM